MDVRVGRLQVLAGSLLLGGAAGSQTDDLTSFAACLVAGLGLASLLAPFVPDRD